VDGFAFDRLARTFAAATSRRSLLGLFTGAAQLSLLITPRAAEETDAAGRRRRRKKPHHHHKRRRRDNRNGQRNGDQKGTKGCVGAGKAKRPGRPCCAGLTEDASGTCGLPPSPPAPPACAASCSGCCTGESCQPGTATTACGRGGVACQTCGADAVCAGGVCTVPACGEGGPCLVFLSSVPTPSGALGGLTGADGFCQNLANVATPTPLPGTYQAWLSDNTGSPSTRFTQSTGPYRLVTGETVAANWTALLSGTLQHAIDVTENRDTGIHVPVWSDTTITGTLADGDDDCSEWMDGVNGFGQFGSSSQTNNHWTDNGRIGCASTSRRLYCFQQQ
jgi:hypothetical protein